MSKKNSTTLKNTLHSILIASTVICTLAEPSQAMEDTVNSVVKFVKKLPGRIETLQETLEDAGNDFGTVMYRTFEEKEPETLVDKVGQFIDYKAKDLEKGIERKVLRPITKFLGKILS